MHLAIISDTHDNLATLDKFLDFIGQNPVRAVIHCGDIASGVTLERLAKGFDGKIFAVFGNMDYRESVQAAIKKYPQRIKLFENFGNAEFGGLEIGFCHHKETALEHCQESKYDFIFYGHTHKPWLETVNNCQLANPGTLAGMFYQATFALLDTETKKLELKIIGRL
jgi:uncharacterized protein